MNSAKTFLGANIKFLRHRLKRSQDEVAALLDIKRSTLNSYENGVALTPPIHLLLKMSDYFKFSLDALVRTDLSKISEYSLREMERGYTKDIEGKNLRVLYTSVDKSDRENIELVPVKSKAGYTAGYNDPEYISSLPAFQLPFLQRDKKYRAFQLDGDSMLPIPDGAHVVGEYVQNLAALKDGSAYIIVTRDEGVVFKVVYNQVRKRKKLLLRSLNSAYKPYEIDVEQVMEAWKFVNYFTSEIPDSYSELSSLKKEFRAMSDRLQKMRV
jgi:transcriptional regulator with XRE-family HTH domain